jgi:hypothetical protein
MRLTLRTLLAYLDDTLDPNEIRTIGQKVKESDAAQELVARIKQVTRRRRLTAPPTTGPGGRFDPNTIAEYLDNVLPSEQVSDVEKTCLESDVHLAEIAACHQILTLVLGEPALVPPTARQRMYGLVRGREAIPYRRAPVAARTGEAGEGAEHEGDDTLLLGLPFYRRRGLFGILMPVAAVLLFVLLGGVIWFSLQTPSATTRGAGNPTRELPVVQADTKREDTKPEDKKPDDKKPDDKKPDDKKPDDKKNDSGTGQPPHEGQRPPAEGSRPADEVLKDRRPVGQVLLVPRQSNLLLQRKNDRDSWARVGPDKPVFTGDQLVALPGFHTTLQLQSGLDLMLWGNVPEAFLPVPYLESAVVLHNNPGVALDFTLDRGRVLITSQNDRSLVCRVHFGGAPPTPPEVWEVSLDAAGTEVAMEVVGRATPEAAGRKELPPETAFSLIVLKGEATVTIHSRHWGVDKPRVFSWDTRFAQIGQVPFGPEGLAFFRRDPPSSKESKEMLAAMDTLLPVPGPDKDKPIELVLDEALQSKESTPARRSLAVYSLGALDILPKLLDCVADEDHVEVRQKAILTLIHWLGRKAENEDILLNALINEKKYKKSQAEDVLTLLHGFTAKRLDEPETWSTLIFYLKSDRPIIRELSYYHLIRLVPQARGDSRYEPGTTSTSRENASTAWKILIPENSLPPKPPPMPPR